MIPWCATPIWPARFAGMSLGDWGLWILELVIDIVASDYNHLMRFPIDFRALVPACLVALIAMPGCVRRTISITSDPTGALVTLNGREVGRTPLDVDFLYYGTYDVVLEKDGCEPLLTFGEADAPIWDNVPLDLFAELAPANLSSHIAWHYMLEPRNDDPAALVDRAREVRDRLEAAPHPATEPAATAPEIKHKKK